MTTFASGLPSRKKSHNKCHGFLAVLLILKIAAVMTASGPLREQEPMIGQAALLPVIGVLTVPAVFVIYNIVAKKGETLYERSIPHNPATGCMFGAEPRDMGPDDAQGAVLLVHGFIGDGANFSVLPDRIAIQGWHVRVMRLPGHGTKPSDLIGVTGDSLLAAVETEAASLRKRYGTVVLIGHSMGGTLSTLAAAEGYADRLVLCAPYFGVTFKAQYLLPPETWVDLLKPAVEWVRKTDKYIMVNRKEAKPEIESYRWLPLSAVDMLNGLGDRGKSEETLSHITCPVLVIHSTGDEAASFAESRKAFDAMPSADKTFHELTTSNHHLFFDYEREETIAAIIAFLGKP